MTFKETLDALKGKIQSKITNDSSAEEIEEANGLIADIDSLGASHEELVQEHAKTKDTLVRMVTSQGSGDKPRDESGGSKPKTIEECVAEELEKEQKGGK